MDRNTNSVRESARGNQSLPVAAAFTVQSVVQEGNCMGCGTCTSACPTGALQMELDDKRGVLHPVLDESLCTQCGRCLEVCPGREVLLDDLSDQFLDGEHQQERLGRYRSLWLGAATDEPVRFQGASGGLITALLIYALETNRIDGAIVLGHDPEAPLQTRPVLARSREEILAASGSKYCPSAVNVLLGDVRKQPGTYAVVGLPCHVHAIRKWQATDPVLRERIRYVFGLFCANSNTYLGTEYFLRNQGIHPDAVQSIRYRAQGWPGEIEVRAGDLLCLFGRATTEKDVRKKTLLASAFHHDFMIPRCLVCPDQTGELADLSFADPHLSELRARVHDGISWCIARTATGENLLTDALRDGVLSVGPFPEETARRAQNYTYKEAVGGRMADWKACGRPVPSFGRSYPATRRMRRLARAYHWSFHSHHRWVWPWIRLTCICVRTPRARFRKGVGRMKKCVPKWMRPSIRRALGRKAGPGE